MSEVKCLDCRDTGKVWIDGEERTCKCRVRLLYNRLKNYRNTGDATEQIKNSVRKAISKPGPDRLFMFVKKNMQLEGVPVSKWWKKYVAYYLFKSKNVMSWRELDLNFLTNLYMGSVNHGLEEGQIEDMFYHFKEGTFVLTFSGGVNKTLHVEVLRIFLDHYRDRNILLFFEAETAESQFHWLNSRGDMRSLISRGETKNSGR